jgi:pilus assembly protein Flp/PilA
LDCGHRRPVHDLEVYMNLIPACFITLFIEDKGVTAIEYGLIAAMIAVAIIASISTLGGQVETTFGSWSSAVQTALSKSGS